MKTLTLNPTTKLAFDQFIEKFAAEEHAAIAGRPRDKHEHDRLRRALGNRLLKLAVEAVMESDGPISHGCAWWKLVLTEMSDEERAAETALIHASIAGRNESALERALAPIDDATEAAVIAKLQAGQE